MSNPNAVQGDTIAYSLIVKNVGPYFAENVEITDILPDGLSFVSGQNVTVSNNTIKILIPRLDINNQQNFLFNVVLTKSGKILNRAAITRNDMPDIVLTNNQDSVLVNVAPAVSKLSVSKSVLGTPTLLADGSYKIDYQVAIQNTGNTILKQVQATDDLTKVFKAPATFTVVSGGVSGSVDANQLFDGKISTNLLTGNSTMRPNESKVLKFSVNVALNGNPDSLYYNIVNASATGFGAENVIASSNPALASLNSHADLQLIKTANVDSARVGTEIDYMIKVKNFGPNLATNVKVIDKLPEGLVFVSSTDFTIINGIPTANIGRIAKDSTITLTLKAKVTLQGDLENTASVTAADQVFYSTSNSVRPIGKVIVKTKGDCSSKAPVVTCGKTTGLCPGESVVLKASGCIGTVRWSDGNTGITNIVRPSVSTPFYAECVKEGCPTLRSNTETIEILLVPSVPTVNSIQIDCVYKIANLSKALVGQPSTGGVFEYFAANDPNSKLIARPDSITGAGTYYVFEKSKGGCYGTSAAIEVKPCATDRKSTRLNSSHRNTSRMPSSA